MMKMENMAVVVVDRQVLKVMQRAAKEAERQELQHKPLWEQKQKNGHDNDEANGVENQDVEHSDLPLPKKSIRF
jgi:hypothetical protein